MGRSDPAPGQSTLGGPPRAPHCAGAGWGPQCHRPRSEAPAASAAATPAPSRPAPGAAWGRAGHGLAPSGGHELAPAGGHRGTRTSEALPPCLRAELAELCHQRRGCLQRGQGFHPGAGASAEPRTGAALLGSVPGDGQPLQHGVIVATHVLGAVPAPAAGLWSQVCGGRGGGGHREVPDGLGPQSTGHKMGSWAQPRLPQCWLPPPIPFPAPQSPPARPGPAALFLHPPSHGGRTGTRVPAVPQCHPPLTSTVKAACTAWLTALSSANIQWGLM